MSHFAGSEGQLPQNSGVRLQVSRRPALCFDRADHITAMISGLAKDFFLFSR